MTPTEIDRALEGVLEELAAIEHARWSHWQAYMHRKCALQPDGSLVIPAELVAHWERQIARDYVELAEDEKESDREQVRAYIPLIKRALSKGG